MNVPVIMEDVIKCAIIVLVGITVPVMMDMFF
jgi:hypothetical protein